MATAVLRSHDALNNRMHLDAFAPSPTKPRRRRSPKPAGASSPSPTKPRRRLSPKPAGASSPPPRAAAVASPPPKAAAVASPPVKGAAAGRRSPPARPAARKQPSPTKEKPKQRLVMEEVRILKRGEEPPAPAPVVAAAPVAQAAAAVDQRVLSSTGRIRSQAPAVVPTKKVAAAAAATPAVVPTKKVVAAAAATTAVVPTTTRKVVAAAAARPAVVPTKKVVAAAAAPGYAGPAFCSAAPEPSSLPMPALFLRRVESEATRGLRCLLRIGEVA